MKKYLISLILLAGCANPEYKVMVESLPKATPVAMMSSGYRLEKYYDSTTNVVCYRISGSGLSCVRLDSTK